MGNEISKSIKYENISLKSEKIFTNQTVTYNESSVFKPIKKHNKECQDSKLIEDTLLSHFFFQNLEKQARTEIIKELSLIFIEKGKTIFPEGSVGNFFYIIKEGTIEVSVQNTGLKKTLKAGECFGEISLLFNTTRTATIKTLSDVFLWYIERKNFNKITEHIAHISFEETKKVVQNVPLLSILDHDKKIILTNHLYKMTLNAGTKILTKHAKPVCVFFIKEGEVNIVNEKDNKLIRTLKKYDYFGERSILTNSMRSFSAITKTKCQIYALSLNSIAKILGNNTSMIREHILLSLLKHAFLKSNAFKKFNVKLLEQVFHLFKLVNYTREASVYKEGTKVSSKITVLIDGSLINAKTRKIVFERGTLLFDEAIFTNNTNAKLDYDLLAQPDCLILEADTSAVLNFFNLSMKDLIARSSLIEQLRKVNIFKNLTQKKLESISNKIKIEKIKKGENVITQGEEGTKFYIIKSGKVDIFVNDKYIRTMNENEYLGERALFFEEKRSATAKANSDVEVFYLDKGDFMSVIQDNLKEFLRNRLCLQDNTVQLSDLMFYDLLGSGSYGMVSLVKSKKNNYYYAIKNISTKQILHEQLHSNLELERSILLQIDHPFIVKLVKTLKDKKYVYFLMEYIQGKELFDVIREIGLLNKFQTQFYSASMMLAVEYLHERRFIFRDIKPENIMVLKNGYIKLIDFGTAKKITEDKAATIIGTPHYMAPEVILGDGYSFQVDFWSIAICMYEFMCGAVPFGENAEEPMDVYLAVINDPLQFPPYCKDRDFKHLMQLMLTKNQLSRYSKLGQISSHVWFQTFNWDDLISMNMHPAFIPSMGETKGKGKPVEFVDYVKQCKEWEPYDEPQDVTKEQKTIFENWLEKF